MSTIWKDEDIPSLIAATGGVPCTIDGVDGIALMDWNDELFSGDPARGQVIVGAPMLTIQSTAFPNVKVDSSVLIDGQSWTVRERLKYGDGGTTKLFLLSAPGSANADGGGFIGGGGAPIFDGGTFLGGAGSGSLDGGSF